MLSLAIFGGNKVDGSTIEPGERVVGLAIFGGIEFDFTAAPPPVVELVAVAVFGGVTVKVRPEQEVSMSGFSLFGGRSVAPRRLTPPRAAPAVTSTIEDDGDLPLDIEAYAVFGGVSVERKPA